MTNTKEWEKERENENPTIKEFREKYAQEIDLLLRAVPGSEWPEHQAARILYSLLDRQKEEVERVVEELSGSHGRKIAQYYNAADVGIGYRLALSDILAALKESGEEIKK